MTWLRYGLVFTAIDHAVESDRPFWRIPFTPWRIRLDFGREVF